MARPKKHGLKQVPRHRADGSLIRTDYYHRATGRLLGSDLAKATQQAEEIDGAVKPPPPPTRLFDGVCASYFESEYFRTLKPRSQALNRLYVGKLLKRFAGTEIAGFDKPAIEAFKQLLWREIRDVPRPLSGTKKPRLLKGEQGPMTPDIAKGMMNKLSLILSHAARIGEIPLNPAFRMKTTFGVKPRSAVWSPKDIETILTRTPSKLRVAAALLFDTAQRPSDVMQMDWSQVSVRGGKAWIKLTQQKTGELIEVPAHRELADVLSLVPAERRAGLMVPSPRAKKPWSYRNFARAWDVAVGKVELEGAGLQRRDLRRTAMVRMAEAGATDTEIAAVSGHSIEQTRQILATYIPRRGEVAAGATAAWERMSIEQDAEAAAAEAVRAWEGAAARIDDRDIERMRSLAAAGVAAEAIAAAFGVSIDDARGAISPSTQPREAQT